MCRATPRRIVFFQQTLEHDGLAESLVSIGTASGVKTEAIITRMDAPLGCAVGNALEDLAARNIDSCRVSSVDALRQATFDDAFLKDYRQAACAHRQVRQWAQREILKPGNTLYDIAESIEDGVRALVGHQGLEPHDGFKAGIAFPTGLCLNNTAAHSTPTPGGKKVVLQYEDVMAVDFGVHVNGRIVDSAFTVAFDPVYDNLLAAVKAATNTGVKVSSLCHLHTILFLFPTNECGSGSWN